MASSSWLFRDIMSILHLASSISTAFFLCVSGEGEKGLGWYRVGTFTVVAGSLQYRQERDHCCFSTFMLACFRKAVEMSMSLFVLSWFVCNSNELKAVMCCVIHY